MMILCPRAGSLAFTPPGDEMIEVISRCPPHRQLWLSNLSKVVTQWLEVDSNLQPLGCKAQNIPLDHRVLYSVGNDWVDIFYRVANPSIWKYYMPDPVTNQVSFVYM